MITYQTREENRYNSDIGFYTAFGVAAMRESDCIEYIPDIFTEKSIADHYVKLFTELELDIIHLQEVIEDIIS